MASVIPLEVAKKAYAALWQEAISLGTPSLTLAEISKNVKSLTIETISNYLTGKHAPSSADHHDAFFESVAQTVRTQMPEDVENILALEESLKKAWARVDAARRQRPTPKHLPSTNEQAIKRVLSASMSMIDAYIDSADCYGIASHSYFQNIGVLEQNWEGPLTYFDARDWSERYEAATDEQWRNRRERFREAKSWTWPRQKRNLPEGPLTYFDAGPDEVEMAEQTRYRRERVSKANSSISPPPKKRNAPNRPADPDSFYSMGRELKRFADEFAAMPRIRDSLRTLLSACNDLENSLDDYWDLNRPCVENPQMYAKDTEVDRRLAICRRFVKTDRLLDLVGNPDYITQLRELSLRADANAEVVKHLARTAADEVEREAIRRAVEVPPNIERLSRQVGGGRPS